MLMIVVFVLVLLVIAFVWVIPALTTGISHTFYSGFWMNGYLYPLLNFQATYGNKGYQVEGGGEPITTTSPLVDQLNDFKVLQNLALTHGRPDPNFNMNNNGSYSANPQGSYKNVIITDDKNNGKNGPMRDITLITALYDSSMATSFKFRINNQGQMTTETYGSDYIWVATTDPDIYGSIGVDASTPPQYMALTLINKSETIRQPYYETSWSYGNNFQEIGDLASGVDMSYVKVLKCTVTLPRRMVQQGETNKISYYLGAGAIYYYNRQGNIHNIGGPALLNRTFEENGADGWWNSRLYSSCPLFWDTKPFNLLDMWKTIHGGGNCSVTEYGNVINNTGGCSCMQGSQTCGTGSAVDGDKKCRLKCKGQCPTTPTGGTGPVKGTVTFGPWCEWMAVDQ